MFILGHIGMTKLLWRTVMNVSENQITQWLVLNQVQRMFSKKALKRDNEIALGSDTWFLDQRMISVKIQDFDSTGSRLVKRPFYGLRLDRDGQFFSTDNWKHVLEFKFDAVTDCHSYHEDIFDKWHDLFVPLLAKCFDKSTVTFLNKYYAEYNKLRKT